jgi:hypothetical protein
MWAGGMPESSVSRSSRRHVWKAKGLSGRDDDEWSVGRLRLLPWLVGPGKEFMDWLLGECRAG